MVSVPALGATIIAGVVNARSTADVDQNVVQRSSNLHAVALLSPVVDSFSRELGDGDTQVGDSVKLYET